MAKKIATRLLPILGLLILLGIGSAGASAQGGGSTVYIPLVTRNYESWSTNFANVADITAAEIYEWSGISDAQLSINTTNVHSGGKSIQDSGSIDYQHNLQTVFFTHGLTGQDSVDLADKTLSIEIYIPSDSHISLLTFGLGSGDNNILVRANIPPQRGRWYTYQVDLNMVTALGSWEYADWLHSPGISTNADAINLLQHVQYIQIFAQGNGIPTPTGVYLLIDRVGWESSGPLPSYNFSVESLRKYADARGLLIGTFLDLNDASDPHYMRDVFQEFSLGSVINIGWPDSEPAGDNFDTFVQWPQDIFLDNVAGRLGSLLIRYAVYPILGIPGWLLTKDYADTQTILENYVRALASYHQGNTKIWYVFNELLRYDIGLTPYRGLGLKDRNQTPQTWVNNYSPFSVDPSDVTMIEVAFSVAHEVDPDALLFLNDGCVEEMGQAKTDAHYNLLAKLVSDGTPIDGVGLQTHLLINPDGTIHSNCFPNSYPYAYDPTDGLTGVVQTVERYAALGLKVSFSEADVSFYTADIDPSTTAGQALLAQRLQWQAQVYRSLMHIALTHSNVVAFIMQGWADQYAWTITDPYLYNYQNSGLFDVNWQRKPSYDALLDELKTPSIPLPGTFDKVSPADGAQDQPTSLTLSWGASPGAASYEYCLDTDANEACDTSWVSTGTNTSVDLSSLTPGTTYSWQVRARNASGLTHADGAAWWSFTVPIWPGTNLALHQPVTASSYEDPVQRPAENAVDGSYSTRWASEWSDPQWIQVDLDGVYSITHVVLDWESAYATAYQIQVSDNGTDWTPIYSTTTGDGGIDSLSVSSSGRYVRMYGTARGTPWGYSLWEFEVYGTHP